MKDVLNLAPTAAKAIRNVFARSRFFFLVLLGLSPLDAFGLESTGAYDAPPQQALAYRGFEVDLSLVSDRADYGALVASTKQQVEIVLSVNLMPDIIDYFRKYRIKLTPEVGNHGRYSKDKGVELGAAAMSPATPVLLHEYLHAFHNEKLPGGRANPDIISYYQRAKMTGAYPAAAYMLRNPSEFFAMTASAYLYGRIARPPCDRQTVKAAQPYYYHYLGKVFRLAENDLRPEPQLPVSRACRQAGDFE